MTYVDNYKAFWLVIIDMRHLSYRDDKTEKVAKLKKLLNISYS